MYVSRLGRLDLVPERVECGEVGVAKVDRSLDGEGARRARTVCGTCRSPPAARARDRRARWRATLTTANSRSPSSSRSIGRSPSSIVARSSSVSSAIFGNAPADVGPVEADLRRLARRPSRRRRAPASNAGCRRRPTSADFSARLMSSQLASTSSVPRSDSDEVAEHVRMPTHELVVDARRDVGDREPALPARRSWRGTRSGRAGRRVPR